VSGVSVLLVRGLRRRRRARRVIDEATICRWREDEPRTPPATLGMGLWHYQLLLHLSYLLLAGLFASTRLLSSHAGCRRRCGSACILRYPSRGHQSIHPCEPSRLRTAHSAANQVQYRELISWSMEPNSRTETQEELAVFYRAQSSQGGPHQRLDRTLLLPREGTGDRSMEPRWSAEDQRKDQDP
jgi:hypothetical protein